MWCVSGTQLQGPGVSQAMDSVVGALDYVSANLAAASTEELVDVVAKLGNLEVVVDALLAQAVITGRTRQVTWKHLGEAVGVTTNSAWLRWRRLEESAPGATGHRRGRRQPPAPDHRDPPDLLGR